MFLIIGILTAAFMEYMLHRYYLHLATHSHITHHHKIFKENYEDPKYKLKDIVSNPGYIFVSSLLALTVMIIFLLMKQPTAYWIYIWAVLYLIWLEVVHYLFHSPKKYGLKRQRCFKV